MVAYRRAFFDSPSLLAIRTRSRGVCARLEKHTGCVSQARCRSPLGKHLPTSELLLPCSQECSGKSDRLYVHSLMPAKLDHPSRTQTFSPHSCCRPFPFKEPPVITFHSCRAHNNPTLQPATPPPKLRRAQYIPHVCRTTPSTDLRNILCTT